MSPEINQHQLELETLCRRFRVRRLELFGSRGVRARHPGKSELDFLVGV